VMKSAYTLSICTLLALQRPGLRAGELRRTTPLIAFRGLLRLN
jgi:hypothetical protein